MELQRQHGRKWASATLYPLLCAGLLLVLASLAACGSAVTTTGGSGSQPASASPTTTAQVQQCGKISTLGPNIKGGDEGAVQKAENCLLLAFQHCQPAVMTLTQSGVDAGVIHTFTVAQKNGKCVVTDGSQHYIAPSPLKPAITYTCASVKQLAGEYIVSQCGTEGDVKLPGVQLTSP